MIRSLGVAAPERVRLFVALELPETVRSALVCWRSAALREPAWLRPVAPAGLHATLCFLGWRAAGEVEPIVRACRSVAGVPAPELALGEVLWLPPRRPRVLAVALEDRDGRLSRLQAVVSGELAAGGWYEPERRPYLGHITVGRIRSGVRRPAGRLAGPPAERFRAGLVTVYRSLLSPHGARYEALERIRLPER